jgi:hypothetical protein
MLWILLTLAGVAVLVIAVLTLLVMLGSAGRS